MHDVKLKAQGFPLEEIDQEVSPASSVEEFVASHLLRMRKSSSLAATARRGKGWEWVWVEREGRERRVRGGGYMGVWVSGCVGVWAVSAIYAGDVLDGIAGMWSVSIFSALMSRNVSDTDWTCFRGGVAGSSALLQEVSFEDPCFAVKNSFHCVFFFFFLSCGCICVTIVWRRRVFFASSQSETTPGCVCWTGSICRTFWP